MSLRALAPLVLAAAPMLAQRPEPLPTTAAEVSGFTRTSTLDDVQQLKARSEQRADIV